MGKYMDMLDVRKGGGRKTGMGAMFESDERTVEAFNAARAREVTKDRAEFLLDLHDGDGTLLDTILLDSAGFRAITGEEPKSIRSYAAYDREYWKRARREHESRKNATA